MRERVSEIAARRCVWLAIARWVGKVRPKLTGNGGKGRDEMELSSRRAPRRTFLVAFHRREFASLLLEGSQISLFWLKRVSAVLHLDLL